MTAFPFVCIVSQEVPHSKAAGSIILHRLFNQWPADRLVVYGPRPPDGAEKLQCDYHEFRSRIDRIQYSRLAPLAPILSHLFPVELPTITLPKGAVVVSVMQSSAYYRAALRVARDNRAPLILIIHDDPEEIEPVRWWSRFILRHFNTQVYRAASLRFCISPQMAIVLAERYGVQGNVLYPNRSRTIKPRPENANYALRREGRLVIGYVGALGYGYGHRIEQLLPIFRRRGVIIRIYSLQEPWFTSDPSVEYAGRFSEPNQIWPRVQAECDAVILPYHGNPGRGHEALYTTHFPSKLTEYLALGMPLVITGPTYATGVQWGRDHPNACVVIPCTIQEQWDQVLQHLIDDPPYRSALANGAVAAAFGEFDPVKIEAMFRSEILAQSRINDGLQEH